MELKKRSQKYVEDSPLSRHSDGKSFGFTLGRRDTQRSDPRNRHHERGHACILSRLNQKILRFLPYSTEEMIDILVERSLAGCNNIIFRCSRTYSRIQNSNIIIRKTNCTGKSLWIFRFSNPKRNAKFFHRIERGPSEPIKFWIPIYIYWMILGLTFIIERFIDDLKSFNSIQSRDIFKFKKRVHEFSIRHHLSYSFNNPVSIKNLCILY